MSSKWGKGRGRGGGLPRGGTDATLNSVLVERQWDDNPEANTLLLVALPPKPPSFLCGYFSNLFRFAH